MSPRSRAEVEQSLENIDRRLAALREREAKLTDSESVLDQLQVLATRADVAHQTASRLQLERERVMLDVEDVRKQLVVDSARAELGEGPAPTKARTGELAKLEAEVKSLAERAEGMSDVVRERRAEWARFRDSNAGALRAEVMAESEQLHADMRQWAAQHPELASRWQDLDMRWGAITRADYSPSSPRAPGHVGSFPVKLEGRPAAPVPTPAVLPLGRASGPVARAAA